MGVAVTKIWQRLIGKQEMRILMVGLDDAGKTTILYKVKLGEVVTTIPTTDFYVVACMAQAAVCFIRKVAAKTTVYLPVWPFF